MPCKENERLRRLTSLASVSVALILSAAKIFAYFSTGSIALLSSLVDSGLDLAASLITAFSVNRALEPPDRDHRYGHGKAEALAAMAQSAFIVGSAVFLSFEALGRFVRPKPVENPEVGFFIMLLAILFTLALLALQNYTVRKTGSLAIAADRLHYASDILVNLAVILALLGQSFLNLLWIDPLFALLIAALMSYGAFGISRKSLDVLMDSELPEAERQSILALVLATPGVEGAHDLRTRSDSLRPIIEIHIEMAPSLTLAAAHKISEAAEKRIRKVFPRADILVHQDPSGLKEARLDQIIEKNDPFPT